MSSQSRIVEAEVARFTEQGRIVCCILVAVLSFNDKPVADALGPSQRERTRAVHDSFLLHLMSIEMRNECLRYLIMILSSHRIE